MDPNDRSVYLTFDDHADDSTVNNLMLTDLVKGLVVSLVEFFLADVGNCAVLKLVPVKVL